MEKDTWTSLTSLGFWPEPYLFNYNVLTHRAIYLLSSLPCFSQTFCFFYMYPFRSHQKEILINTVFCKTPTKKKKNENTFCTSQFPDKIHFFKRYFVLLPLKFRGDSFALQQLLLILYLKHKPFCTINHIFINS